MSIFIFSFSICLFYFVNHYKILTWARVCENIPYFDFKDLVARLLIWVLALGNGITFIRFSKSSKTAAVLGTFTLYIFVYHQFCIEVLVKCIDKLFVSNSIPVIVVESIIVIIICSLIATIPFFRHIVNPITYLLKRKVQDQNK